MKKIIFTLLVFISIINSYSVKAQDITFPDQWMRANMFSNYNAFDSLGNGIVINQNGDNAIQQSEALRVYSLKLGYTNSIQSLEGIQYFSNLRELEFIGSSMTDLSILNSLTDLRVLKCYNNTQLTTLNVSNFSKLKTLLCYGCKIAALDVSNLTSLETLDCKNNNLTSLNITNCTKLKQLSCENNQITSLNASNLTNLETMTCQNNKLATLTINGDTKLQTLNCSNNLITSLDANNLVNLKSLTCSKNKLNSITLLGLINLESLYCNDNQIASLDLSNLSKLISLYTNNNLLTNIISLGCINLREFYCDNNQLTSISLNHLSNLQYFLCSNNNLSNIEVNGAITLKGLTLNNNQLATLNVSNLVNLLNLSCNQNRLTSLEVSNLTNLILLSFGNNMIPKIDVFNLVNLQTFNCSNNLIDTLNVTYLTKLVTLICNNNRIKKLNIRNLKLLQNFYCNNNQLTELDATSLISLKDVNCSYNQITKLNISDIKDLQKLQANNNKLIVIYMKNGLNSLTAIGYYIFSNNPTLRYICADEVDISALKQKAISYNYNTTINTLCNTNFDGTHYTLDGAIKFDLNNNGCTASDPIFPNLKIKLKNATDSGYALADRHGNFSMIVDSGNYTITPQLLHANNYFMASPSSIEVSLPEDSLPSNFCIVPNGTHHELSVSLINIRAPRPGFSDARYKVIVTNNGNQIGNGSVTFNYTESNQDFVIASKTPNKIESGKLTFTFSNLLPYESEGITIKMRTNSPSENPAVNRGQLLSFSSKVELANGAIDDVPQNNEIGIKTPVVGACDPNDKVCVEGDVVTPSLIGDYVNYVIRFENVGDEPAENVVVVDYIDLQKFDINTLEITSTSHDCKTTITNGNKVQFIFDNIFLPITDPEKYGHVAFKIKTKNNLEVGDSLKNKADIYFDYNLPIITNTFKSIFSDVLLGIMNKSIKEGNLQVFPNPNIGNFTINFEAKGTYPVNLKIIDIKGSTVYEKNVNHSEKSNIVVDANDLSNGIYLINITAGKDNWVQKLMIVK
ncbi:MAG TPA: T9SS type A sorting domain-containing protein [Chitinophagales bacterium]|nr:T9SS type A sorting domain-containing protein [Chitinophagales bacterium]